MDPHISPYGSHMDPYMDPHVDPHMIESHIGEHVDPIWIPTRIPVWIPYGSLYGSLYGSRIWILIRIPIWIPYGPLYGSPRGSLYGCQMSGAGPPCAIILRDNVFQAGTVGNGPGPMPKTGPKIGFGFRKLSPQWRCFPPCRVVAESGTAGRPRRQLRRGNL